MVKEEIQGVFDGQIMVSRDGRSYAVPSNYASKSKLVQGDEMVLKICEDGSFIFKQTKPKERKRVIANIIQNEDGRLCAEDNGSVYRIIDASITFFKLKEGDKVAIAVPRDNYATWAAIEYVIN